VVVWVGAPEACVECIYMPAGWDISRDVDVLGMMDGWTLGNNHVKRTNSCTLIQRY